ncbi:MAG: AraC family transcriptional regulator [Rhodospirillales bacterium]|nr:AraC family transcriptional regulator [Rhodospirillales bacterium]
MQKKRPDRLSALIQRFRIDAKVLPVDNSAAAHERNQHLTPNLFIIGRGCLNVSDARFAGLADQTPVLVFFPRGAPADFTVQTATADAEFVCASVDTGGVSNPISLALPDVVTVALQEAKPLQAVTDILLDEAFAPRCGGRAVIDRLCEIVVIRLLRHLIEAGKTEVGLVAGLAHPNISQAIVVIHNNPEKNWHLEDLAEIAAMSRTHFANTFRKVVGVTPGEYLSSWRLTLARMEITKGTPLKTVVRKVGFSSSAALSRAFKRRYGISPRQDYARSA